MGQPLCCSAANAGAWGERGYGDDSTPYMWLSSIALLPWLPGFPPPAFPTMISSLNPLNPSLCYQQQPSPWHCSTIPKFPFPAAVPSRWPAYLSGLCMAVARTVWFSFHLGCHRSAVSLSALNVSPLTQTVALLWNWTPASVPLPTKGRSSPTNTLVFPPKSFILPSFAWVYIFFSTGQVLLSALHCCSECTSGSEGVFPMYPWRQMYSMSTYPLPSCSLKASYLYQTLSHAVKAKVLLEYYRYYCY